MKRELPPEGALCFTTSLPLPLQSRTSLPSTCQRSSYFLPRFQTPRRHCRCRPPNANTWRMGLGNSFGRLFRVTTFGESHGTGVGVIVDGCPPRLPITLPEIQQELNRRRPGQSRLTTPRNESDTIEVFSGIDLESGVTLGTPIGMVVRNKDHRSKDYGEMEIVYRPSHADAAYDAKYGIRAVAGGGRSSARETIGRVAGGAIAKKFLKVYAGIEIVGFVKKVKDIEMPEVEDWSKVTVEEVEKNIVRCPCEDSAKKMIELVDEIRKTGNSVGGVVECVVKYVPAGLGSPVFDKLEADLAKACMSLPASKGFEVGSGFDGTLLTGIEHNDPFYVAEDGRTRTASNRSGGVQGGISNGEPIVLRVAFKPTSTIGRMQKTVTRAGKETELRAKGRHDPCVLPRAVPMVESMVALVLADHVMQQIAQCEVLPMEKSSAPNPLGCAPAKDSLLHKQTVPSMSDKNGSGEDRSTLLDEPILSMQNSRRPFELRVDEE